MKALGGYSDHLPTFGPPDVANENYTATVLKHVQAADQLQVYVLSRLSTAAQLAAALEIVSTDTSDTAGSSPQARVFTEAEPSVGAFLAYDWLAMLTTTTTTTTTQNNQVNKKFLLALLLRKTSLRSRLEEEVSFRSNIPSPSGITSYLGRCKTVTNCAAIDAAHCPEKPLPPVADRPATSSSGGFSFSSNTWIPKLLFNPFTSSAPASGGLFSPHQFVETRFGAPAPKFGATTSPISQSYGNVPFGGGLAQGNFAASYSTAKMPSAFGGPTAFGFAVAPSTGFSRQGALIEASRE